MNKNEEFIKKIHTYPLDEQKEFLKTYCKADETKLKSKVNPINKFWYYSCTVFELIAKYYLYIPF